MSNEAAFALVSLKGLLLHTVCDSFNLWFVEPAQIINRWQHKKQYISVICGAFSLAPTHNYCNILLWGIREVTVVQFVLFFLFPVSCCVFILTCVLSISTVSSLVQVSKLQLPQCLWFSSLLDWLVSSRLLALFFLWLCFLADCLRLYCQFCCDFQVSFRFYLWVLSLVSCVVLYVWINFRTLRIQDFRSLLSLWHIWTHFNTVVGVCAHIDARFPPNNCVQWQ